MREYFVKKSKLNIINITKSILLITLAFLVASCDIFSSKATFSIDNPTKNAISINIDGKQYDIPALSHTDIELGDGYHFAIYNGETIKFNFFGNVAMTSDKIKGGILNPTLSNYYVNFEFYQASSSKSEGDGYMKNLMNSAIIKGKEFDGTFIHYNGFFIEQYGIQTYWMYGLDEDYPKNITTTGSAIKIVGKIFREDDFIGYINSQMGDEPIEFDYNFVEPQRKLSDTKVFTIDYIAATFNCTIVNDAIAQLNENIKTIQTPDLKANILKKAYKNVKFFPLSFLGAKDNCKGQDAEESYDNIRSKISNISRIKSNIFVVE